MPDLSINIKINTSANTGAISGLKGEVDELKASFAGLEGEAKDAARALDKVGDEAKQADSNFDKTSKNTHNFETKLHAMGVTAGIFLAGALKTAGEAAINFAKESRQAFLEFDQDVRQVMTLVETTSNTTFESMSIRARQAAEDMQRIPDEVLPAIYQGLSRGISEENIFKDLELANKAARAGMANLEGTLVAGQSVVKAYGDEVLNLTEVYDLFFFGIKEGAITMQELTSGISEVTSAAGEVGVPLSDVIAMLVVMTNQGDSFNEAIQLSALLVTQLGIEGSVASQAFIQSWGGTFREFIAQGGNMAEAMQIIQNHAEEAGIALGTFLVGDSSFFRDTQAMRGALELTGIHLEEFLEITGRLETEAAGSMEKAFDIMDERLISGQESFAVSVANFKITFGELIEAAEVTQFIDAASDFLTSAANVSADYFGLIISESTEAVTSLEEYTAALAELDAIQQEIDASSTLSIFALGSLEEQMAEKRIDLLERLLDSSKDVLEFRANLAAVYGQEFADTFSDEAIQKVMDMADAQERLGSRTMIGRIEAAQIDISTAVVNSMFLIKDAIDETNAANMLDPFVEGAEEAAERIAAAFGSVRGSVETYLEEYAKLQEMREGIPTGEEGDPFFRLVDASSILEQAALVRTALTQIKEDLRQLAIDTVITKMFEGETFNESIANLMISFELLTEEEANQLLMIKSVSEAVVGLSELAPDIFGEMIDPAEADAFATAIGLIESGAIGIKEAAEALDKDYIYDIAGAWEEAGGKVGDLKGNLDSLPEEVTITVNVIVNADPLPDYVFTPPDPNSPPPGSGQDGRPDPYAHGGIVTGGIPGVDSVRALLTPGELVIPAGLTGRFAEGIDALQAWLAQQGLTGLPSRSGGLSYQQANAAATTNHYTNHNHHYYNREAAALRFAILNDLALTRRNEPMEVP